MRTDGYPDVRPKTYLAKPFNGQQHVPFVIAVKPGEIVGESVQNSVLSGVKDVWYGSFGCYRYDCCGEVLIDSNHQSEPVCAWNSPESFGQTEQQLFSSLYSLALVALGPRLDGSIEPLARS